jgi:hypothetical protein
LTAFNKNIRRFALSRTWPGASLTINSSNSPFIKIKIRIFFRLALLILVIAFLGSCSEIREIRAEETAVRQVFEDYKTAVLEMNGSESVRYLTRLLYRPKNGGFDLVASCLRCPVFQR